MFFWPIQLVCPGTVVYDTGIWIVTPYCQLSKLFLEITVHCRLILINVMIQSVIKCLLSYEITIDKKAAFENDPLFCLNSIRTNIGLLLYRV